MTKIATRSWLHAGLMISTILIPVSAIAAPVATNALPVGGVVGAGQASVAVNGAQMTVTQTSDKAILNWQGFDIGAQAGVTFIQPNAASIALNRVSSADPSQILGSLKANGQLVLINPAGMVFGGGATVNVGGLTASTLNLADQDFLAGNLRFTRSDNAGSIENRGTLRAADGGYIALVAPRIGNSGLIEANFGSVALAAGDVVTLAVAGRGLLGVTVDPATVRTQIDAGGVIRAPGGKVLLTAQAANALYGGAINAHGIIEADSLDGIAGAVMLTASGDLDISGATISALAGQVETSAKGQVTLAGASVRAADWLIDPDTLTIDAAAAATIETALAIGNVTLQTTATNPGFTGVGAVGTTADDFGDIIINAALSWSSNQTLTLDAYHGVTLNAPITASGTTAGLTIKTNNGGSGGWFTVTAGAPVTLSGAAAALTINNTAYTLISNASGLQAIGATGNYALAGAIDLSAINSFSPLGGAGFTGTLEGLGNTINALTIVGTTAVDIGMFTLIAAGGRVANLAITGGSVQAISNNALKGVGMLAGANSGTVYNVSSAGLVAAGAGTQANRAGGLVGFNTGTVDHSRSSATVTGGTGTIAPAVGGLIGLNSGQVSNSYATGTVTGGKGQLFSGDAGGLVGANQGDISNSYATGTVTGGAPTGNGAGGRSGGLVGENTGGITSSFATGTVTGGAATVKGAGGYAGGLVGYNSSRIENSYATGATTGGASLINGAGGAAGGLVGYNGSTITNSYATGRVTGGDGTSVVGRSGGLVGDSNATPSAVTGNYWDVTTTGQATDFYTSGVTGLTTLEWLTQGPGLTGSTSGWNVTSIWLQGYPYPVLRALPYITVNASATGAYGGTLSIDQGAVSATDHNGANALGLLNLTGIRVIGGSTTAVGTLSNLGGAGAISTTPGFYQIAYAPVSATINPATLTYSVANASSTYGTLASLGLATLTGFVGDDAADVDAIVGISDGVNAVTLAALTAAGSYDEIVTNLTGSKAANYVIAESGNSNGTLTIDPLAVVLTGSRVYDGSTDIAGTALTASNLIGGDSLTFTGSATLAAKDVGARAISSTSGLSVSNSNYTVTGATGSVTIDPLAVILTGARTYDAGTDAAAGILAITNNLDDNDLTLAGSGTLSSRHAGSSSLTSTDGALTGLSLGGAAAGNYTLSGGSGVVTVGKAPLIITALDATINVGDSLPVFTPSFTGLLGDSASVVDGLSLVTTAQPDIPGVYAIIPQGGTARDYAITHVAGTLTVNQTSLPPPVSIAMPPTQAGTILTGLIPSNMGSSGQIPPSGLYPNGPDRSDQGSTQIGSFMSVNGDKAGGMLLIASDAVGGSGAIEDGASLNGL